MIEYNTNTPTEKGVYACRVISDDAIFWLDDVFLLWDGENWCRLRSDQLYRGDVLGWIGPLQRKM